MSATDVLKVSILGKESIHCGFHLIPYVARTVLDTLPSSAYVIITDTHVAKFHLASFESEFNAAISSSTADSKPRFLSHVIAPGETSKSREGKAEVEDRQGGALGGHQRPSRPGRVGFQWGIAVGGQVGGEKPPRREVVLYDQDLRC